MNLLVTARELFVETLHSLDIENAMRNRITREGDTLTIGGRIYQLQAFRRIIVIAVGKAAVPMMDALLLQIQPALTKNQALEGIVVGSSVPAVPDVRFRFFLGDHPLPGSTSRAAAMAAQQLLATCDQTCLVFFLISGGASAMLEQPLDNRFSLEETAEFHQALVHSGLPITKMNALRKHFSRVKGGRLAIAARGATQCTLLISDVPGDALHIVGSGPSLPDPSTVEECRQLIQSSTASLHLSNSLLEFFRSPSLEETPKPDHPAFSTSAHFPLLSSEDLCARAKQAAAAKGFHVEIDNSCDDWDYRDAAKYLLDRLEQLRMRHTRVCLLSSGEVSVQLPPQHGIGGRNQQFVLECARLLAAMNLSAAVLSGGSDGADGNSSAAGAVGDETTMTRAAAQNMDVNAALERFDSATVFAALGDAILTGPTGNNVRDLRILLSVA
jgi:glycerate 2-kinase